MSTLSSPGLSEEEYESYLKDALERLKDGTVTGMSVSSGHVDVRFIPTPSYHTGTDTITWTGAFDGTVWSPVSWGDPFHPAQEELVIDVVYRTITHWGKNNSDVMWVGTHDGEYAVTLDDFADLVGTKTTAEYDFVKGFVIVGDGWWIKCDPDLYPDEYHHMMMHRVPSMGTSPRGVLDDEDGGMLVKNDVRTDDPPTKGAKWTRSRGKGTTVAW